MNRAMYESSFLTERKRDKAISDSFLGRIQNETNPTTGSAPLLGISEQSIINHVRVGQMSVYQKKDGGCTLVNPGCPCDVSSVPTPTPNPNPCPLDFYWATNVIGPQAEYMEDVAVGSCGYVYAIGTSYGTTTFNSFASPPPTPVGSVGVQPFGVQLSDNGNPFAFIVKYNVHGTVQWVTKIGQVVGNSGISNGVAITIDSNDNIYVTGTSKTTNGAGAIVIYNANASIFGTMTLSGATNTTNSYVVKYNSDGNAQWATFFGGDDGDSPPSYGENISTAIAVDTNFNVFVTGYYNRNANTTLYNYNGILPGPTVDTQPFGSLIAVSAYSAYTVKLLPNGTVDWATNIIVPNPIGLAKGFAIAVDTNGDAYMTGSFAGGLPGDVVVFNRYNSVSGTPPIINTPIFGTLPADSIKDEDAFVVKYTGSGVTKGYVVWATSINTTNIGGQERGRGIAVDANSNVYVTGNYSSVIDVLSFNAIQPFLPGGPIQTTVYGSLSAPFFRDVFVVKYTSAGVVVAMTNVTGPDYQEAIGIVTDSNADVYVLGRFASNFLTINNAAFPTPTLAAILANDGVPGSDGFVVKYDTSLTAQWANNFGSGPDRVVRASIALDPNANVHVVGNSGSYVNINSAGVTSGGLVNVQPYGVLLNPSINLDGFVIKYNKNGQIF